MIELNTFLDSDFERLISWIENEEELIQFAGPIFQYPLTYEQLRLYINKNTRKAFKVCMLSTGEIIGHCELNFQNAIPRLSRILIGNKQHRNKGIGKQIVESMLNIVFSTTDFDYVDLNVFDWNANAIASYKNVGFKVNEGFETTMTVGKDTWKAFNMVIGREEYLSHHHKP
jgi:RimJ/RimL family protein N-acetyltransferase